MLQTLNYITRHPLTQNRPAAAVGRFINWQLRSRLQSEVEFNWIEGAKLVVKNGMAGATGNIYCGLHEFTDMAFVLHLLRPGDLFVDAGANIGSYSVLASKVCGAQTIAIEPDPATMAALQKNIRANGIEDLVETVEVALGPAAGTVRFTIGLDTVNQVAADDTADARHVRQEALDALAGERNPVLLKLDVEGYEEHVLAGAVRTLQNPSLLAVETEGVSEAVVRRLEENGFERWSYEPFSKKFSKTAKTAEHASNALFVRNINACRERVMNSPSFNVLGHRI